MRSLSVGDRSNISCHLNAGNFAAANSKFILIDVIKYVRHKRFLFYPLSFLVGIILLIAIAEIGLRVAGYFFHKRVYYYAQATDNFDHLIVCVGDSHTEGIGAPKGQDFPTQLASILNLKAGSPRYKVINLGHAGYNSSQAVNVLFDFLRKSSRQPDIIIFNAGNNNDHNFAEARILPQDARMAGTNVWIEYLLANSRAFRLGQITVYRLKRLVSKNNIGELENNDVLNVWGKRELELLERWLLADIEVLSKDARSRGAKLVLLNYFTPTPWVDRAFTKAASLYDIPFIDVRGFGYPLGYIASYRAWVSSDWHPNQYGYARIAEMVYSELVKNGAVEKGGD